MTESVIYETVFDNMKVQVVESTHNRYLKFGNGLKQSSMNKKNPRKLQLKYSKEILKIFEHIQNPKNVLILGLGGGILPSFIHENYSDVIIDVVDNIQELKDINKQLLYKVSTELNKLNYDLKPEQVKSLGDLALSVSKQIQLLSGSPDSRQEVNNIESLNKGELQNMIQTLSEELGISLEAGVDNSKKLN